MPVARAGVDRKNRQAFATVSFLVTYQEVEPAFLRFRRDIRRFTSLPHLRVRRVIHNLADISAMSYSGTGSVSGTFVPRLVGEQSRCA
jgi:hypothetical protein